MSIDLQNPRIGYEQLRQHIGHDVVCAGYGPTDERPENAAIECKTCGEVLLNMARPPERDGPDVRACLELAEELQALHRNEPASEVPELGMIDEDVSRLIEDAKSAPHFVEASQPVLMKQRLREVIWRYPDYVRAQQNEEPLFLTNQACEVTGYGNTTTFARMGLTHGLRRQVGEKTWVLEDVQTVAPSRRHEYEFYPLTPAEDKFIREDCIRRPEGLWELGYTGLYRGRKWFMPSIELVWATDLNDLTQQQAVDRGRLYADPEEVEQAIARLIGQIHPKLEQLTWDDGTPGQEYTFWYFGEDRHCLNLLIPMDVVVQNCISYREYKRMVEELVSAE